MTGSQIAKLTASDVGAGAGFGNSVAFSGATALVGAHEKWQNGSAYLYDAATGSEIGKPVFVTKCGL